MKELSAAQTAPHVYQAIAETMARLAKQGISKDRKNEAQGYAFRGIDDVYNALAPIISDVGLCILPQVKSREVIERQTRNGGTLFYVNVDVDFHFVSTKDGSSHVVSMPGEAMDSGDKATNKAMSAAFKYACLQAFCIPTEGDNDADSSTHQIAPRAEPTVVHQAEPVAAGKPRAAKLAEKTVGDEEIKTITKLAQHADIPLDVICGKYKVADITQLPISKTAEVVARLQALAQDNAQRTPA
jgi:ERF superfamily